MRKVPITVTQADIEEAYDLVHEKDFPASGFCPNALAIQRELGEQVTVDFEDDLYVARNCTDLLGVVALPPEARALAAKFDTLCPLSELQPLSYELEVG